MEKKQQFGQFELSTEDHLLAHMTEEELESLIEQTMGICEA